MNIGITGHQKLPNGDCIKWLKDELKHGLLVEKNISCAYSSLAVGADQLFAEVVLQQNIDLIALIPCLHYENTFSETAKKSFYKLLSKCKYKETLDFPEPSENAFLAAGREIVERVNVLFAIWDGEHAKGLGGTGDIVEHALSLKKSVIHFNPILKTKRQYNL